MFTSPTQEVIDVKDGKEFIKELKEVINCEIFEIEDTTYNGCKKVEDRMFEEIDKLAGDKLSHSSWNDQLEQVDNDHNTEKDEHCIHSEVSDICIKCGHHEKEHDGRTSTFCSDANKDNFCRVINCGCRKFESEKVGCGKPFQRVYIINSVYPDDYLICGFSKIGKEVQLCKECSGERKWINVKIQLVSIVI